MQGLYQDPLGRAPAQSEVDAWVMALHQGTQPMAVALGFAASAEREGQHVTQDYLDFLGRRPTSSEVDAWVTVFTNGSQTNEDVQAGFAGSREYYQQTGGSPDNWWRDAVAALFVRGA